MIFQDLPTFEWYDCLSFATFFGLIIFLFIRSVIRNIKYNNLLKHSSIEKMKKEFVHEFNVPLFNNAVSFFLCQLENDVFQESTFRPYLLYMYKRFFFEILFENPKEITNKKGRFHGRENLSLFYEIFRKSGFSEPSSSYSNSPLFNYNLNVDDKRFCERLPTSDYYFMKDISYLKKRSQVIKSKFGFSFEQLETFVRNVSKKAFENDCLVEKIYNVEIETVCDFDYETRGKIVDFIISFASYCEIEIYAYDGFLYSPNFYELELSFLKMAELAIGNGKVRKDRGDSFEEEVRKSLIQYGEVFSKIYFFDDDKEVDAFLSYKNYALIIECKSCKYNKEHIDERKQASKDILEGLKQLDKRLALIVKKNSVVIRKKRKGTQYTILKSLEHVNIIPLLITEEDVYDFSTLNFQDKLDKEQILSPLVISIDDFKSLQKAIKGQDHFLFAIMEYYKLREKLELSDDQISNFLSIIAPSFYRSPFNFRHIKDLRKTLFMSNFYERNKTLESNSIVDDSILKFGTLLKQKDPKIYNAIEIFLFYSKSIEDVFDKRFYTEMGEIIIRDDESLSLFTYSYYDITLKYNASRNEIKYGFCEYKDFIKNQFLDHFNR